MTRAMAAAGSLSGLPPRLRLRTLKLAAQALGELPVDQVPRSLRRAAAFAPARRAKLAGEQIVALVESDPEFRESLAVQVRGLVGARAAADERRGSPRGDDDAGEKHRLDAAATAFLVRPDGWEDVVDEFCAAATNAGTGDTAGGSTPSATEQRLAAALVRAGEETQELRERLRAQLERTKTDNAELRRTLGGTRQSLRQAERRAASALADADTARREREIDNRSMEADARQLRRRIGELETRLASLVRTERTSRDAEATRLRLLLDTVTEAAAGLRRELALPPVELLPADTVRAVEPTPPDAFRGLGRGLSAGDPSLLRRLLELPRLHLVVDGYNVTKTAWPTAPLEQQRTRLIRAVAALVAGKGVETTLVFDGARATEVPAVGAPQGMRVRFSPPGVIADDVIRELVASEPSGRPVVVISSDRELGESVLRRGARCLSASAMIGALPA